MTTPRHDPLFRLAFEAPADAAALLCELMPSAIRAAVAWETLRRDDGALIDAELTGRYNDRLFYAELQAGGPERMYFVLEHQSTGDPMMPLRALTYQNRIWNRYANENPRAWLPPVIAVLVSQVPGGWREARAFEELFDPAVMAASGLATLVPRFSMIVADLMELSNDDLAARALRDFPKLALWLLRDARDSALLLGSFEFWAPSMVALGQTRSGLGRLEVLIRYMFQVIDPMHLDELRVKIRTLGPRIEKVAMSIAEYFHEEGHKAGREEGVRQGREEGVRQGREEGVRQGREEGVRQGRIDTLRSLLVLKFQRLGAEYEDRLQAATPEAIDRYQRRLLTADSLVAVFED